MRRSIAVRFVARSPGDARLQFGVTARHRERVDTVRGNVIRAEREGWPPLCSALATPGSVIRSPVLPR
jgi:hypothetical protein